MLFKKEHKEMILNGTKTATRRVWKKPMVKVGGIYKCKLKMFSMKCKLCGKVDFKKNLKKHMKKEHNIHNKLEIEKNIVSDYFAKFKVTKLYKQKLKEITEEDVLKEGYKNMTDFFHIWEKINGEWKDDIEVYVIEFEVIKNDR